MQVVVLVLIFLCVAGVAAGLFLWAGRRQGIKQRVERLVDDRPANESVGEAPSAQGWQVKMVNLVSPIAKLAMPAEGWENSELRTRFIQAGLRESYWPRLYFAGKALLALIFPFVYGGVHGMGSGNPEEANPMFVMLILAGMGYYFPNFLLKKRLEGRRRAIDNGLPDALDLMVVCVEAGLGLDAAMTRAGSELTLRSPDLAEELQMVQHELSMGMRRDTAMRNLVLRSGSDDVASFVTTLIQADRFGTNVGAALRVQAESMRIHRRMRAEERAAKIPVKLLLPLVLFIFPSLLVVLAGPALLSVGTALTGISGR